MTKKEVLTLAEVCTYTGYSKNWLYKLTSKRALPYFKPEGKAIFFKREDVEAFLLRNRVTPKSEL